MSTFQAKQAAYEASLRKSFPNVPNATGNIWGDLILNELVQEDEVSDAILALLILKQFEQSTTESSQEESTEDGQTQPTPDPRRDILSRKRARSPSRELTPCPGQNREREAIALAHARKRLCTPQNFAPSTPVLQSGTTTATTTPTSSSNVFQNPFLSASQQRQFISPETRWIAPQFKSMVTAKVQDPRLVAAAAAAKANGSAVLNLPQSPQQPPFPRGFRPDAVCIKAMRDVKARMTGHATEAHISSVCKKFLQYPKLPAAYLAVCDDSKLELFWMFAGDMGSLQQRVLENCEPPLNLYEKGILKLRMGARPVPRPVVTKLQHNSVLQTQHIKEIDGRPRPTLQDRVKMWLANVTGP